MAKMIIRAGDHKRRMKKAEETNEEWAAREEEFHNTDFSLPDDNTEWKSIMETTSKKILQGLTSQGYKAVESPSWNSSESILFKLNGNAPMKKAVYDIGSIMSSLGIGAVNWTKESHYEKTGKYNGGFYTETKNLARQYGINMSEDTLQDVGFDVVVERIDKNNIIMTIDGNGC
jgi:hypothetical protein